MGRFKKTYKKSYNKKRKTKRRKNVKTRVKRGGNDGTSSGNQSFILYSGIYHIPRMRPIYKFTGEKKGSGGFADIYEGTVGCVRAQGNCIDIGDKNFFRMFSKGNKLSQYLQKLKKSNNAETGDVSAETYILRVYGKKYDTDSVYLQSDIEENTKRENNGVKFIHDLLTRQCKNHVLELYDYGLVMQENENDSNYVTLATGDDGICIKDKCFYAIMEKGTMDFETYFNNIKKHKEYNYLAEKLKLTQIVWYVIKMIRNIQCLHKQNIMHYDIKLQNSIFIKIAEDSNLITEKENVFDVKLIDFGNSMKITKFKGERAQVSSSGHVPYQILDGDIFHDEFLQRAYDDIYAIFVDFSDLIDKLDIEKNASINKLYMETYEGTRRKNNDFLNSIKQKEENNNKYKIRTYIYDETIYNEIIGEFKALIQTI
jgi:serine/threonine protein kinase